MCSSLHIQQILCLTMGATTATAIVLSIVFVCLAGCFGLAVLGGCVACLINGRSIISKLFGRNEEFPEPAFTSELEDQGITSDYHMEHVGKITFQSERPDVEVEKTLREEEVFNGKTSIYAMAWLPQSAYNMILNAHETSVGVKGSYLGFYLFVDDKPVKIARTQGPIFSHRGAVLHEGAFNVRSFHDDMLENWTAHPIYLIFPESGDKKASEFPEYLAMAKDFTSFISTLPSNTTSTIRIEMRINVPPSTYETLAVGSFEFTPSSEKGFFARMADGWKAKPKLDKTRSSKKLLELVDKQGGL